jgi:hypothetical protein
LNSGTLMSFQKCHRFRVPEFNYSTTSPPEAGGFGF